MNRDIFTTPEKKIDLLSDFIILKSEVVGDAPFKFEKHFSLMIFPNTKGPFRECLNILSFLLND